MKKVFACLGFIALLTSFSPCSSWGITKLELAKIWEQPMTGLSSQNDPSLSGNEVIFKRVFLDEDQTSLCCPKKRIYQCFNQENGKSLWEKPLDPEELWGKGWQVSLRKDNAVLYKKERETNKAIIKCVDLQTKQEIWNNVYGLRLDDLENSYNFCFTNGNKTYFGNQGKLTCINNVDGSVFWEFDITDLQYEYVYEFGGKVIGIFSEHMSHSNEFPYTIVCNSTKNGEEIWKFSDPLLLNTSNGYYITFNEKHLFLAVSDYRSDDVKNYTDHFFCFDINSGELLWKNTVKHWASAQNSIVLGDNIFLFQLNDLVCLNPITGDVLWTFKQPDEVSQKIIEVLPDESILLKTTWTDKYHNKKKSRQLVILDNATGIEKSFVEVDANVFENAVYNNGLFFFDDESKAYCYKLTQMPDPPAPKETKLEFKVGSKEMKINGVAKPIDSAPAIIGSRTYLPARHIIEPLGGTIEWDGKEKKVTCKLPGASTNKAEDILIELWVGNPKARINGAEMQIDQKDSSVCPRISGGRTLVPMRFIGENLGCIVEWIQSSASVILTKKH